MLVKLLKLTSSNKIFEDVDGSPDVLLFMELCSGACRSAGALKPRTQIKMNDMSPLLPIAQK